MRRLIAFVFLALAGSMTLAQEATPDARVVISRDVDYPGGDLSAIFDTTLDACQAACLSNPQCTAFTFNQRSNSCFPKVDTGVVEAYAGAISGRVIPTPAEVQLLAANRLPDLDFLEEADIAAARSLAAEIGRLHAADSFEAEALLAAADQARGRSDLMGAFRFTGAAVSLTDRADLWLEYGRLARIVIGDASLDVGAARNASLPAIVNAYLRADSTGAQVTVLAEMAYSLEAQDRGRLGIPALRLAQEIGPRRDVEAALDRLIGLYGFRVAETDVQSDSATPRLCVRFSEPLVQAGVDYSTYIQLPDPRLAVTVEGAQLCVDGVTHGERYRVVLREGLPAESGESLVRAVELTLYVRDRTPSARFVSRAYVLPRMGEIAVPLETVNLETVNLSLARVSDRNILRTMQEDLFASPLYPWQDEIFADQIGEVFWTGTAQVAGTLNQDSLTRLPLSEALAGQQAGVYVLRAAVPGADPYETPPATQWFVLSDLGLATMQGVDGLTVVVRSLADASAVVGAEVQLLSRANSVLGTVQTDAMGVARFEAGLSRGTGSSAPGLVTVRNGPDDLAFLSLTDPAFDLSDRGVEGREPAPPIDVFLTTDRGAYRAGETINVTALMRDAQARALPGVPLTAILSRPDGVEYSRISSTDDSAGGHVFALTTAGTAPRGSWRIDVLADVEAEPLASTSVLVEDFLPERIDFDMVTEPFLRLGQPSAMAVAANYLFGPPAPDLPIEGEVLLRSANGLTDWPGYQFGRQDEPFEAQLAGISGSDRTDADGSAIVALDLPEVPGGASQPLEAIATLRLTEGSGRPVERSLTVPVRPDRAMIGIRPATDGVVPEGGTARFSLIGLSPDLTPEPMLVQWTINRLRTNYQWYQLYGEWSWEPTTNRTRIATGTATLGAEPVDVSAPVEWGEYEIVVERTGGDYISASASFYAGWYAPADTGTSPDLLEASLDAESYAIGDTAQFRIVPRYAGTAIVTVMTNRVVAMQAVEVTEGETLLALPVTEEWGAGAYVTASVLRPMDVGQDRNPARSMGLAYAPVAPGDKQLSLSLDWNADIAPRGPLTVRMQVEGATDQTYVTLAAVDVGILNITGFESPDPSGHYFGQRKLGVELRDIYGRLIDGMNGAMGTVRSGGDAQGNTQSAPPPTEELVSFFSGPVALRAGRHSGGHL
jgi:alpha-2-macroglobulin